MAEEDIAASGRSISRIFLGLTVAVRWLFGNWVRPAAAAVILGIFGAIGGELVGIFRIGSHAEDAWTYVADGFPKGWREFRIRLADGIHPDGIPVSSTDAAHDLGRYLSERRGKTYADDKRYLSAIAGESVEWTGFVAHVYNNKAENLIVLSIAEDTTSFDYLASINAYIRCYINNSSVKKSPMRYEKLFRSKMKIAGTLAVIQDGPGVINDCKIVNVVSSPPR